MPFFRSTCKLQIIFLLVVISYDVHPQVFAWRKKLSSVGQTIGINPLNPNSVYAEKTSGSFYVSYDRGNTWSARTPPGISGIRQILVHPSDTMTIFCATGGGGGLRKSADYGSTWETVITGYNIDGESVTYDPVHPDTMYAGRFDNGSAYRSTNRGGTWTMMGSSGSVLCALAVRPDSVNILYGGSGGGMISKSTDFGATWKVVYSGSSVDFQEVPKIITTPMNPLLAYATVYGGGSGLGVLKTTDGGENWLQTSLQGIPVWGMVIDPTNTNIVYAGTFGTFLSEVYKTTDGGASWNSISSGLPSRGSIWSLKLHPLDPSKLWAAITTGAFGFNGIFRWTSSTTTVQGKVLDAGTGNYVSLGYIKVTSTGDSVNLSQTNGSFNFGYFEGDPSLTPTAHIAAFPYYPKDEQLFFTQDSTADQGIIVSKLPVSSIEGTVKDSLSGNPIHTQIRLTSASSFGTSVLTESTDVEGRFRFDTLPISYPGVVSYSKLDVDAAEVPFTSVTVTPIVLDSLGVNLTIDPRADIFLVGEDSANYSNYYLAALQSLGIKAYTWNLITKGAAPLRRVNEFKKKVLIYFTGDKHTSLSGSQIDSLKGFLDLGGNLFLTGQDIAELNDTTSLLKDDLGIQYGGSPTIYYMKGVSASELFSTAGFWIGIGSGANNQTSADILVPTNANVRPVLGYGSAGTLGTAGVRINSVGGKSKVVVFGFGFEAIYLSVTQKTIMQKILGYFDGSISVDVRENNEEGLLPPTFGLEQNYPNPFNPLTVIRYQLPVKGMVALKVYNMLGQEIAILVNEVKEPGSYEIKWDAANVPTGVYFYQLKTQTTMEMKKMVVLR